MIVLAVFSPIIKFPSVVIQTAKILTPKNVLAAGLQYLPNAKMTFKREAVSRIVYQVPGLTPAYDRESTDASPVSNSGASREGRRRFFSISEDW